MSTGTAKQRGGTQLWNNDPDQWAKKRSRYIKRACEFDDTDAKIIAWAELGYSHSGITKQVDICKSTVRSRMSDIDEIDDTALWSRLPRELEIQSPVGNLGVDQQ